MSLVRALVATAFDGDLPPRIDALVPWDLAETHRLDFKAGPVLRLGTEVGRAYVANVGEPEGFAARVAAWLGPDAGAFLATHPGARAMVETDGTRATVFLDDLHEVARGTVMCRTWAPDGTRTTLTRHGRPPRHRLATAWQRRIDDLLHAGLVGLWGVRTDADGEVVSLLWVNDTRWRGDPEATARVIDTRGDARWAQCREIAAASGVRAYPDGIEIQADGAWDVTVGLVG